jgi:hypothetical protein
MTFKEELREISQKAYHKSQEQKLVDHFMQDVREQVALGYVQIDEEGGRYVNTKIRLTDLRVSHHLSKQYKSDCKENLREIDAAVIKGAVDIY